MHGSRALRCALPCALASVTALLAGCLGTDQLEGVDPETSETAEASGPFRPLMFLHGHVVADYYTGSGRPANNYTSEGYFVMEEALRSWGFSGPTERWGYYAADRDITADVHDHPAEGGGHDNHRGGPTSHTARRAPGWHGVDTPIEHIAYHWAWGVYDLYTSRGECVDVVAHSMGGVVVRYAIGATSKQSEAAYAEFPPHLCVARVVTVGTPHAGTDVARACISYQCEELVPGSAFMSLLSSDAAFLRPQGTKGTAWFTMGSDADETGQSPPETAVAMDFDQAVMYFANNRVNHNSCNRPTTCAYFFQTQSDASASMRLKDRGEALWNVDAAHTWPVRTIFDWIAAPG